MNEVFISPCLLSPPPPPPPPPPRPLPTQRNWLSAAKFSKPRRKIVKPTNRLSLLLYMVVTYYLFDLVIYGIIAVNGVCALGELFIRNTMALQILEYINVVFVTIYIVEAVLKASYTWLPSKLDTAGITACVL